MNNEYPIFNTWFEAVDYANGNALIPVEMEDGRWTVAQPPVPYPTKEELIEELYRLKSNVAYSGLTLVKYEEEYQFATAQDDITMCNSQAIAFSMMPEGATVDWKVYQNGFPTTLTLTKAQFLQIFSFGMQMINNTFAVEGDFNIEVQNMTEQELKNKEYIANFRARAESSFGQIPRRYELTVNS